MALRPGRRCSRPPQPQVRARTHVLLGNEETARSRAGWRPGGFRIAGALSKTARDASVAPRAPLAGHRVVAPVHGDVRACDPVLRIRRRAVRPQPARTGWRATRRATHVVDPVGRRPWCAWREGPRRWQQFEGCSSGPRGECLCEQLGPDRCHDEQRPFWHRDLVAPARCVRHRFSTRPAGDHG
jgi:hypothetical protein